MHCLKKMNEIVITTNCDNSYCIFFILMAPKQSANHRKSTTVAVSEFSKQTT
uniref:Bm14397 n=1 Tax=Brugia malayi TaxID=6279 RepID=A0A1I9G1U0_BRUMA|nr:Bm14397 [Brugia malayi]